MTTASPLRQAVPSEIAGMGGIVLEEGCSFRVWAPNADSVSVIGAFNDWDPDKTPLAREEGGTWSALVPEAKEGDAYRYHLRRGEESFSRPDPRGRVMENSVGNTVLWRPHRELAGAPFTPPTGDQLVIYELHIGSFHVPEGSPHGTFESAISQLPYLRSLGINAVEVMPIAEFAGDLSWGYNPAHPYAIEAAYGGPGGFLEFVDAAHRLGIAVILDVVYNHFGPSDLGLWRFDGWSENELGGIYFYNDWRASTPWGETRPDYGRGEVRAYIRDNALMWFHEYGVDGLRFDMTVFVRTFRGCPGEADDEIQEGWSLLQWINSEVHREFPHAILIAEDLQNSEWLVKGVGVGGAGFTSQWDAAFVHPVRDVMIQPEDESRDLTRIVAALQQCYDGDAFKRVIYSESHDEVANGKARLPSEIEPDEADGLHARKRSTLAAGLVMTAPGIPMLFQGQEFLEDEWFRDSVPLDWSKLDRFPGIEAIYRDLIALRLNQGGATAGLSGHHIEILHLDHGMKTLAYRRWRDGGPGDDTVVVVNLHHLPVDDLAVRVPGPGIWRVRLNSDSRFYSPDFGDHPSHDAETFEMGEGGEPGICVSVAGYSFLVLSMDPES